MTDNEIIETFENNCNSCENCPYHIYSDCDDRNRKDIRDLIKRQQSEIERLKLQLAVKDKKIEILCGIAGAIRKQSIEKFEERLIKKSELMSMSVYAVPERAVFVSDIENIAKEMTEKKEDEGNENNI